MTGRKYNWNICNGSYADGTACGVCEKCHFLRMVNKWSSHEEALVRAKTGGYTIRPGSMPIIPHDASVSSGEAVAHLRDIATARREQTDVLIAHIEAAISAAESPAVIDALMDLAKKVLA